MTTSLQSPYHIFTTLAATLTFSISFSTETMTMFENVTRALARQLNPRGDLTPLDSLIDFKRFHPFCLVLRKRKSTLFWGARYVRTDYTLLDVLEPGSSPSGQPLKQSWARKDSIGRGPAIWTTRKILKFFLSMRLGVVKPRVLSRGADKWGCFPAQLLLSFPSCRSNRQWELWL